jgi:stage III sporulation protein SpoIIIAA
MPNSSPNAGNSRSGEGRAKEFKDWTKIEVDTAKEMVPPTNNIVAQCPKFRVLIIGRSGVGKTTILGKVFKVTEEMVRTRPLTFSLLMVIRLE